MRGGLIRERLTREGGLLERGLIEERELIKKFILQTGGLLERGGLWEILQYSKLDLKLLLCFLIDILALSKERVSLFDIHFDMIAVSDSNWAKNHHNSGKDTTRTTAPKTSSCPSYLS